MAVELAVAVVGGTVVESRISTKLASGGFSPCVRVCGVCVTRVCVCVFYVCVHVYACAYLELVVRRVHLRHLVFLIIGHLVGP